MSRHQEYVNSAGLRLDGRRPHEVRTMNIALGSFSQCDGSATVELGRSKVCATVSGPYESSNRQDARHNAGVITSEVAVAAFAGAHRRNPQRRTKQSEDISAAVVQVAQSIVLVSQYVNSQIHINVEILQQDGSEKVASINAACLALADANVAMRDIVCSVDAGFLENQVLVDLTSDELRSQCPVLSVAFTGHDTRNIIWFEVSSRLSLESLEKLMEEAQKAGATIFETAVRAALEDRAAEILKIQS